MSDDSLEIGVTEDAATIDAALGTEENPMTQAEAEAAGVDTEATIAEAVPLEEGAADEAAA